MNLVSRSIIFTLALMCAIPAGAAESPQYAVTDEFIPPTDYREWIFLSAGLDMNYSELRPGEVPSGNFGNVFVNPAAYRTFMASGAWPDNTVFVIENRSASSQSSINKSGKFQTTLRGLEFHVKDAARGGWAFYTSQGAAPAPKISESADCYSCHQQHGTVDTTFVQFYPTLQSVAEAKGTFHLGPHPVTPIAQNVDTTPPDPQTEIALRDAMDAIAKGKPAYDKMTPEAAEIVRVALPRFQAALDKAGALQSIKYVGSIDPPAPVFYQGKSQKLAQYEAHYAQATIIWRIFVAPDGTIGRLVLSTAPKIP